MLKDIAGDLAAYQEPRRFPDPIAVESFLADTVGFFEELIAEGLDLHAKLQATNSAYLEAVLTGKKQPEAGADREYVEAHYKWLETSKATDEVLKVLVRVGYDVDRLWEFRDAIKVSEGIVHTIEGITPEDVDAAIRDVDAGNTIPMDEAFNRA